MSGKFEDNLWGDILRERGPVLAQADRPAKSKSRLRRPQLLAGGSLGMAGIAAALVLVLGGSTAAPAFALTQNGDGSTLVTMNDATNVNLPELNAQLAKETGEMAELQMVPGQASVAGPVTCTLSQGATTPVEILVGKDGTDSSGGEATGPYHLAGCTVTPVGKGGES
jgi:hypothetical protein